MFWRKQVLSRSLAARREQRSAWLSTGSSINDMESGDGTQLHDPIRVPNISSQHTGVTPFYRIPTYRSRKLGIQAREHTAQVLTTLDKNEEMFREAKIPILYCSPTMELVWILLS